jgi:hypothetical protein
LSFQLAPWPGCDERRCASAVSAEFSADQAYNQAVELLRKSQSDTSALVPAVRALAAASEACEKAHDDVRAAELNAYLYWSRKKLTLADTDDLKGADGVAKRLEVVAKQVPQSSAQAYLDRANAFAKSHMDSPLLVAIRYFEVGDRFKTTDAGREAIDLSLEFMQKITAAPAESMAKAQPKPFDRKDFVGKWNGKHPEWFRPSVVEWKEDGTFLMVDKNLPGKWTATGDTLTLDWDCCAPETLNRVDADLFIGEVSRGKFALRGSFL